MEAAVCLASLEAVRDHVLKTLCAHDQLDPNQTPLRQSVILRSGRPCGLFFSLEGPRMVKTYAVWAGEEDRILFYDSNGTRFAVTRLIDGPDPRKLAA
jgi:hypothetical protein